MKRRPTAATVYVMKRTRPVVPSEPESGVVHVAAPCVPSQREADMARHREVIAEFRRVRALVDDGSRDTRKRWGGS